MGSMQQPHDEEQASKIEKLKEEYVQLQQQPRRALEEIMEALGLKENLKASRAAGSEERTAPIPTPLTMPEVTFRKEFQIRGQIGEAGQKDMSHLSYTSLTNQIESGVNKGYSEVEIVESVVRTVGPRPSPA